MIIFQNKGLVPIEAIKTMGISAKETERPIGYFGTGLKYAIAIILREGGSINIHRGQQLLQFGTIKKEVRGEEFEIVTMKTVTPIQNVDNGIDPDSLFDEVTEELGFTTELGKNWVPWMAFRELYCNCMDENGEVWQTRAFAHRIEDDETCVVVSGDFFEQAYGAKSEIILETKPKITAAEVEVHPNGPSQVGYYRGICARQLQKPTIFQYNITGHCELTEDRTIKYDWEFFDRIKMLIVKSQDKDFIEAVLTAPEGSYEHSINYVGVSASPS
jgi:hypothetical protein